MDWIPPSWSYWLTPRAASTLWGWGRGEPVPAAPTDVEPRFTDLDLWLLQVTYEFIAAELRCVRCGAPLGRGLRVVPPGVDRPGSCALSVVTRCHGWRRHRYVAVVGEAGRDLVLGRLIHP